MIISFSKEQEGPTFFSHVSAALSRSTELLVDSAISLKSETKQGCSAFPAQRLRRKMLVLLHGKH